MHFVITSKIVNQNPEPILERFYLIDYRNGIKTFLNGQMTKIIGSEVRPKNRVKLQKVVF